MIEFYSHEQLLTWVESASDPQPHVLLVSTKRGMQKFLHKSSREARGHMMMMHCFDPDLVKFESHRPATPEEIARDPIKGKLLFE
jgi:hypothetical protein